MSLYLGPIHHWLYNKIQIQNTITESLIELNQEKNYSSDLEKTLDDKCGALQNGKLEDLINESNIHGWLQSQVDIVENRLALATKILMDSNSDCISEINDKMHEAGARVFDNMSETNMNSAEDVYKLLNDTLLDGMPCDRVNELICANDDEVVFARTKCIHEKYYTDKDADVKMYYDIRNSFVNGMLSKTDFIYTQDETGKYHIKRK